MTREYLLQLKNISVHYGGVKALNGVDLVLDEGEVVALIGPNGAGKSTILQAILGLAPIAGGKIFWHEGEIKPVSYEMVDRGIAFVPQGRRVFGNLSVLDNLIIGGFTIRDQSELKLRIQEVLKIFPDLKTKEKAPAASLSGGQQQMLALARGLVVDPRVLLLDEPSLGLSPKLVKEVFAKIKEISDRHKTAILIVEHNIKSLLDIADRAYVLDKGEVVLTGKAEELSGSEKLERVFMGTTN